MRLRQLVLVLALFCLLFVFIDAKGKGKWKKKKHQQMMSKKGHHRGMGNNISKQKMKRMMKKLKKIEGNGDWSSYHPRLMKKVSPKKHIAWLKLKSEKDCRLKCKRGEVCIVGPVDAKLMCVHKKAIKKSMKLFHKYQNKDKKAWKVFKSKHYNKAHDDDAMYFSKFEAPVEAGTGNLAPIDNKKHGKGHGHHSTAVTKSHHGESEDCTPVQFSQMRKRMMGWFHLLHGQSHVTGHGRKANIKHFHKHNSVTKELRELNGTKCECAKSAMWQFHKMDVTPDNQLSGEELAMMYENAAEPCLKPFFATCDLNADEKLSINEWCCCFSNIVAPCFSRLAEIRNDAIAVQYMPRCDREGYYRSEQCSGEKHGSFKCWCVDYNGNQFKNSVRDGRAHCNKQEHHGYEKKAEFV